MSEYFADYDIRQIPLSQIPGFHLSMIMCDPMHSIHLGFAQIAVGSMLVVLAMQGEWGMFAGRRKERLNAALRKAYGDFVTFCRRSGAHTSQPTFDAGMLNKAETDLDFPSFNAKAHNTRWVVMWIAVLLYTKQSPGPEAALFWGLADVLHIMHEIPGPWLTEELAVRFYNSGMVALLSFAHLALAAKRNNIPLWPCKPKMHQVDHLCQLVLQTRLQPSYAWAFADEDFNGRMVKMAYKVEHPLQFSKRTMEKYCLQMFLSVKQAAVRSSGDDRA